MTKDAALVDGPEYRGIASPSLALDSFSGIPEGAGDTNSRGLKKAARFGGLYRMPKIAYFTATDRIRALSGQAASSSHSLSNLLAGESS